MATLRNKRKLAAVPGEAEDQTGNSQSQNTSVSGITEEYFMQVFEEIDGRATEKLSQDFSRTESCILGVLSKLEPFREHPGTMR